MTDNSSSLLASIMGANEYDKDSMTTDQNNNDANTNGDDDQELMDEEPFDIDHYKLLHNEGMSACRGRNILSILMDRSVHGPRYYRCHEGPCLPRSPKQQHSDNDTMSDSPEFFTPSDELLDMTDDGDDDVDIPTTPPPENPFGAMSYHSPTPETELIATTPPRQQRAIEQQPGVDIDALAIHKDGHDDCNNDSCEDDNNNNTNSPNQISSTTPTDISNVTTELTSFIEYAAATKFRGSYLQHLRGDAPIRPPPPPPQMQSAGTFPSRNAASTNATTTANYTASVGLSNMTREQRETQRQLQQHLQQHNMANRIRAQNNNGELPRRRMNRSYAIPINNNNNNNNEAGGGPPSNNPIPNNFPSRRGIAARHHHHRPPPQNNPNRRSNPNNNPRPNNNNQNQHNISAVSTISIDFSPNGRTLASTHGDHTVKITCAHTGKLLRQLEGHPRTPWTVKYHPTNHRIVASGCLGCQVRVWDWNFQKESVRRERREGLVRRWGGRYQFGSGGDTNNSSGGGGGGMRQTMWSNGGRGGVYASSPRGVVDQYWKGGATSADEEGMDCATNATASTSQSISSGIGSWEVYYRQQQQLMTSSEGSDEDDYAQYALAALGIPDDDPAWYDTESDVYNYEMGMGVCLHTIRLNHAIISLSFHPSGDVLAVASGSTLHLWDYDEEKRKKKKALLQQQQQEQQQQQRRKVNHANAAAMASMNVRESDDRILNRHENQNFPNGRTMDFTHDSALRCVHFPPGGKTIIVGGVNPQSFNEGLPNARRERGGMQGGGMSFHLRLWDFDLDAVLDPCTDYRNVSSGNGRGNTTLGARVSDEGELGWNFYVTKESLANPRIIIPRVLLYNDGGFDISKDGKILSACAEYWLPDDVNSATELVERLREMEEEAESVADDEQPNISNDFMSSSPPTYFSPSRTKDSAFPDPRTPPPNNSYSPLEPPSPPGKRNVPHIKRGVPIHNPHPLSMVAASHPLFQDGGGRYVPHIVTVSLDSSPPPDGELMQLDPKILRTESMRRYPKLGQLLMAAPLDGAKASGVTCVKLSPSAEFCLLGYGVRENIPPIEGMDENRHPVTAMYNVKNGMKHVSTLTSADDDVNIARFHPESGHGFVYGTKQGRVRVLATCVWNHYHLDDDDE